MFDAVLDDADACRVNEQPVAFAFVHDLRVASDDLHAAALRRLACMDCTTRQQRFHRQTFLNDESGAQVKRARAAHGQVIHRAVDRHRADVAAGEEERAHDIGIRRERELAGRRLEHCADRAARRAIRCRTPQEDILDELMHQLSAAAVRQQDVSDSRSSGNGQLRCERRDSWFLKLARSRRRAAAADNGIGRARAFARNHRRAQRMFRRAARAERRTFVRLFQSLQHQSAEALGRFVHAMIGQAKFLFGIKRRVSRRSNPARFAGISPTPRHLRGTTLKTSRIRCCAGLIAFLANRPACIGFPLQPRPDSSCCTHISMPCRMSSGSKPVTTIGTRYFAARGKYSS